MITDIVNSSVYKEIQDCISTRNVSSLKKLLILYNLKIEDGKIVPQNKEEYENYVQFWNQRQQATKILLNSLYGALLNDSMKFYDKRIGQSVTLTGRCITKHMTSQINKEITGDYNVYGESIIYNDTDSVASDTMVLMNNIQTTIEQAFDNCEIKWVDNGKEYACDERYKTPSYNNGVIESNFNYIYRHKTNKSSWEVMAEDGTTAIMTDDHSCIVVRDGIMIEVKPSQILLSDTLLSIN